MSDIVTNISDNDVEWTYDEKKADDVIVSTSIFDRKIALAHLLINDVIMINTHWYKKDWPVDARNTTVLAVVCNDVFVWASADAQAICLDDVEVLYRMWKYDPTWGPAAWCIMHRKSLPQDPVRKHMELTWDVDSLLTVSASQMLVKFRNGPTDVE
jgi:hypothetical protein